MAPVMAQMSPVSQGEGQLLKHPLNVCDNCGVFIYFSEDELAPSSASALNRTPVQKTLKASAPMLSAHNRWRIHSTLFLLVQFSLSRWGHTWQIGELNVWINSAQIKPDEFPPNW